MVWFVCFPLTAYTLYTARQFPLPYFGVAKSGFMPMDLFIRPEIQPAFGGVCLAFTLYGLFLIYFNVRNLRKLRRGE